MFLQHFGLTEDPFGVTPDPKFLYFGRQHREALSSLYYSVVESRGFAAMIAAPGMGKTTLLHYLRERMKDRAEFALLVCSFDDQNDLLRAVMTPLGMEPDGSDYFRNWRRLHSFLLKRQGQDRRVVLLCDEAQSLTDQTLENVRLLSNLETTQAKLLQVILAGQPSLIEKLRSPGLEQLGQRVNVSCRIHPLDEGEVATYIEHRLQVAGRTRRLFSSEAVATIARSSQGIPRNVNTLCYNAMAMALALGRRFIDEEVVQSVVCDLAMADFPNGFVSEPISVRESGPSQQWEPATFGSWADGPYNGRPLNAKPALKDDSLMTAVLPDEFTKLLRRLDELVRALELLRGIAGAAAPPLAEKEPDDVALVPEGEDA